MLQSILSVFIAISTLLVQIQTTPNLTPQARQTMTDQVSVVLLKAQEMVDALPVEDTVATTTTTMVASVTAPVETPISQAPVQQPVLTSPQSSLIASSPVAPTCSLVGYLYPSGNQILDYIRFTPSVHGLKQSITENGLPFTGDAKVLTATTTFVGVVTDTIGQIGTCSVTLAPTQPVCAVLGNPDNSCSTSGI